MAVWFRAATGSKTKERAKGGSTSEIEAPFAVDARPAGGLHRKGVARSDDDSDPFLGASFEFLPVVSSRGARRGRESPLEGFDSCRREDRYWEEKEKEKNGKISLFPNCSGYLALRWLRTERKKVSGKG